MLLAAAVALDLLVYRSSPPEVAPTAPTVTTSPVPPPFGIESADAPQPGAYSAQIVWTTTEPATGIVRWAPTGMRPLLWSRATQPTTHHALRLDTLSANTTYTVDLTVKSSAGEPAATHFEFRTAAAPSAVVATVDRGSIRVGGGGFFPLIAWMQCADRWPASIAEGINLFAGNQCTALPSLATGIAGQALVAGTSDDPTVEVPGLLGWFYPDEADARGLTGESLLPTQPGLHFLTLTQHFFAGAAPLPSGRAMYPGLVAKADVVGFDLYPLQEICRRDFLVAVFDAQRALVALAPGKPTFQWIEVRELKCPTVPVTPATIRAESWLAIAGGAHGLGFFPNDWDVRIGAVLGGIGARIRQLGPALLQPAQPVQVETSAADVRASRRVYHGARYTIVVNAGLAAASVRIRGLAPLRLPPLGVRIEVTPPPS